MSYHASASTIFSSTFDAFHAFDNGAGTGQYWIASTSTGWLQMDCGAGFSGTLTSYQVKVNTVPEPNRAPKDFTMQGSNDGSSFTTLDTQTSQTSWTSGETRTFTVTGAANYRYFRLNITANNGDGLVEVAELFLLGTVVTSRYADFVTPHNMINNISHTPMVASASSHFSSDDAWLAWQNSFGSSSESWVGTNSGVDWLKLDTGCAAANTLYEYGIANESEAARAPKTWTMEGSNDNSTWATLDTRSSETGWTNFEIRLFNCTTTTTGYRYFRLNITANNGDATFVVIGELYLYGATGSGGTGACGAIRHRVVMQ